MKQVGVFLHQLHGFQFFEQGLAGDLIDRFTAFFLKMPGISDIADVSYFITQVLKIPVHHIKSDIRTGMTEMTLPADGRSAHIHAHMAGGDRFKIFFLATQGIIDFQVTHNIFFLFSQEQ